MSNPQRPADEVDVELLRYEPNPKHKPIPTPGRHGSICPQHADGPSLLARSTPFGQKRYATDSQVAYCAQQHATNAWHGYPVDWQEVPPRIRAEWVATGHVNRRTIRQAARNRSIR